MEVLGTAGQSVRGINNVPAGEEHISSQSKSERENASTISPLSALYAICPILVPFLFFIS